MNHMRILQVVPFITPGSGLGKYVLNLSDILSDNGHETGVLTTHTIDPEYEKKQLKEHNAECIGQLGGASRLWMYLRMIRLINRYSPDVLVVNYDGSAQFILPFLKKRIKVIHILHNNTDDFYRVGSINARYVDGWIAPTQAIADNFNRFTDGKYSSKTTVIPHGVEVPHINRSEKNVRTELIFVGVHYEHKGVRLLPTIISGLQNAGLDFHFTIVGNGELTAWLKESLGGLSDKGIVTFTGVIPADEVYRLQAKSDIFVYPTHIDAFGLVIAEAMINGTVPVVTDLRGITDNLIKSGHNGFLLPQDDAAAFIDRIVQLAVNPALMEQMKKNAIKTASEKFTLEEMGRNYNRYLMQFNRL